MNFDFAKLERRIAALEANRGASLRFGTVTEVNEKNGSARVQLPDGQGMVSMPLRVLQPRALKDQHQRLPDIGEPVAVLFAGQGFEQGVILGAHYSTKTPAPGQPATHDYTIYEDGTELCYDRTAHKLTAKVKGDVEVETEGNLVAKSQGAVTLEATQGLTLKAPQITLKGNLVQTGMDGGPALSDLSGTFRVCKGDVIAEGVSLLDHLHNGVESGMDKSGPPADGGESGSHVGEGSGGVDDPLNNTHRYANEFYDIYGEQLPKATEQDNLLLCLPEIAQAEIKDCLLDKDKYGWLQLRALLHKWFSGKPNADAQSNPEAFWVNMDWILSYYWPRSTYNEFIKPENLFTLKGKKALDDVLSLNGNFDDSNTTFDFTTPSQTPRPRKPIWGEWNDYFQYIPVNMLGGYIPTGLTASMGNFTFRAFATGHVKSLPQGGHKVTVTGLSVFVHDTFNFEEGNDILGFWRCGDHDFSPFPMPGYTTVRDGDFRNFRNRLGHGNNFMVLSLPKIVENFSGYSYDTAR